MSLTAEPARRFYVPSTRAMRSSGLSHGSVAYLAALVDFTVVLACSVLAVFSYHYVTVGLFADPAQNVGVGLMTATVFVLAMSCLHAYGYHELSSVRYQVTLVVLLIPTVLAFLLAIIFFLKLGEAFSRGAIFTLAAFSIASLIGVRLAWRQHLSGAISSGWLRPKNAFFICPQGMASDDLARFTQGSGLRVSHVGHLNKFQELIGTLRQRMASSEGNTAIDEIIVVWDDTSTGELEDILVELRQFPIPVKVAFGKFMGSVVSCHPESIGALRAFQVQSSPLGLAERGAKRIFDVLFSLAALLFLSPMFLLVALAIKLDSKGPVFFQQRRLGHGSRPFRIIKFRSMTVMEDGSEVRQASRSDARITRVGAFIRATSLDELPQFWNVLRGEMSVVGPRPHAVAHDDVYDRLIIEYAARRHVKPGLTGWAQVKGCRGETPTVEAMEQRVRHDLWYIDNWSLWLDLKIAARTLLALRGT